MNGDELEAINQRITLALQSVDAKFLQAREIACNIHNKIQALASDNNVSKSHLKIWSKFFKTFSTTAKKEPSFVDDDDEEEELEPSYSVTPSSSMLLTSLDPAMMTPVVDQQQQQQQQPINDENCDLITPQMTSPPKTVTLRDKNKSTSIDISSVSSFSLNTNLLTPFSTTTTLSPIMKQQQHSILKTPVLSSSLKTRYNKQKRDEYEDDSILHEDLPKKRQRKQFDLNDLPSVYRVGIGASQVQQVYKLFEAAGDDLLTFETIQSSLPPEFNDERTELMLDLLESKEFIRRDESSHSSIIQWQLN